MLLDTKAIQIYMHSTLIHEILAVVTIFIVKDKKSYKYTILYA